jgi:hypothetical protein
MNKKLKIYDFIRVFTLLWLIFIPTNSIAQLYFPNSNYYNSEIERFNLSSKETTNHQKHLSVKPILDSKSNRDSIYYSSRKVYYTLTQKLFKENLIIFKGDDFWCSIDPVLDLEVGKGGSGDSLKRMYWNTRGIRVQARFFDNVSFSTSIYETQIVVPEYQSDYITNHGEFRFSGGQYKQSNGYVPMYGRTKPFKEVGYDFAFAEGNLSIVASKNLNFQLGNGNQFIGDGYRSFFLSDFSGNYPFAKTEFFLFDGKLQYNLIYASLTNPYRLIKYSTPEPTYERKIGVFHHLDYAVTKHFNISLFEGSNWRSIDSLGSHKPDYLFLNPIIGVNSLIKGTEALNYNSVFGIGSSFSFKSNKIYGQLLIDNSKISSFQIGLKAYDLLIKKLDLRLEYNKAVQNAYLSEQKRYNYSHNNLSLTHPLDNSFNEIVAIMTYENSGFFVQNKTIFSSQYQNDTLNIGNTILESKSSIDLASQTKRNVFYNQLELGYRFNKTNNLQLFGGYLFRKVNDFIAPTTTNYVYFGVRTKIRNKKLDW